MTKFQKLPDHLKPQAAPEILAGRDWYHWGEQVEHPGDDELNRWIPSHAGNVATDAGFRIVEKPTQRMTREQKRSAVDAALKAHPQATNREIARLTSTSHTFVSMRRGATANQPQPSFD